MKLQISELNNHGDARRGLLCVLHAAGAGGSEIGVTLVVLLGESESPGVHAKRGPRPVVRRRVPTGKQGRLCARSHAWQRGGRIFVVPER